MTEANPGRKYTAIMKTATTINPITAAFSYEVNNAYREELAAKGMTIAGTSPDGHIVEMIEIKDHPFYEGTQGHPEFKSRPNHAHPLFRGFVKAADEYAKLKLSRQAQNQE